MMNDLDSAVRALQNGERDQARALLATLLRSNPKNELAWYWLSTCVDSVQQKKDCLSRVIAINPNNLQAKATLSQLEHNPSTPENKTVVSPRAETQPISTPTNLSRPPEVKLNVPARKADKFSGIRGEVWVGIGTLIMLMSCLAFGLIGVYSVANVQADFSASDPTQFKKVTGKYQLVEVYTDW